MGDAYTLDWWDWATGTPEAAFGRGVRAARKSQSLSQAAVAAQVSTLTGRSFDRTALARIEGGSQSPSMTQALALADVLDASVYVLVERGRRLDPGVAWTREIVTTRDAPDPLDDPRYPVVFQARAASGPFTHETVAQVLADIDAADHAAGIVRVDTRDEALVERLYVATERLWETDGFGPDDMIRAALAALREES